MILLSPGMLLWEISIEDAIMDYGSRVSGRRTWHPNDRNQFKLIDTNAKLDSEELSMTSLEQVLSIFILQFPNRQCELSFF